MNLKKITALVIGAAMAFSCAACGDKEETSGSKLDNTAVFTVGDVSITKSEFEAYVSGYSSAGFDIDEAKERAKDEATETISLIALVNADGGFTEEELSDIEAQKESVIEAQGGEDGYKEFLEVQGVGDEFIDKLIESGAAKTKLFSDALSDEEAKEYFDNNYYRAKHILISTRDSATQAELDDAQKAQKKALAEELLERAKGGEDFDAMVSEYSEDPGSAAKPDGYFFTDGTMVEEFQETTKSLGMGEFGLCETTYGYHIIQRLPLDDDAELYASELENARAEIESDYIETAVKEKLAGMLEEKGLTLEINEETYNSITE